MHSEALTCTVFSDASGSISTDAPYAVQAGIIEADVTWVGMGFRRVARRRIDVDKHIVVLPAQVRYRRVPAQDHQRFTDPRNPGAVNLLCSDRI